MNELLEKLIEAAEKRSRLQVALETIKFDVMTRTGETLQDRIDISNASVAEAKDNILRMFLEGKE